MSDHIFIHIPKTAGSSITSAGLNIQPISRPQLAKKYIPQYEQHKNMCHALWRHLNHKYQSNPAFTVIRNPWSRTVSRYTYTMMKAQRRAGIKKERTFEQFLRTRTEEVLGSWQTIKGWQNQLDYITNIDGKVQCNVLRFENIEHEISLYLQQNIQLPHRRHSNTKDYREFYNDKTQQIIADWYNADIDYFGFDFDTTATKNTYYS